MVEIEEELYKIHAAARNETQSDNSDKGKSTEQMDVSHSSEPIGHVTSIDEGSPADRVVRIFFFD